MRNIYLLLIMGIVACASGTANEQQSASVNESSLTADQKTAATEPIMGGPTDFTIKLNDYNESGQARLVAFYFDQNFIIDTASFTNGSIRFVKETGYPQGLYYVLLPNEKFIQVILGEDQKFSMSCNLGNIVETMQVDGSVENEVFYRTSKFEDNINPRLNSLVQLSKNLPPASKEYAENAAERKKLEAQRQGYLDKLKAEHPDLLFTKFKIGGQNPIAKEGYSQAEQVYFYKKEFWDNVDFSDRRLLRTPMIGIKAKRYFKEITLQQPDSIFNSAKMVIDKMLDQPEFYMSFVNYVILEFEPTKCPLMDAESVFSNMVKTYHTHERAFWSTSANTEAILKKATEMSNSLIGQKGPNIISTDQNGKQQELLAKTADYLIIYLYNPDCDNCQAETPKLYTYWQKNRNLVDVYAIGVDTDEKQWKDYINKLNLQWTNVYDPTNKSIYAKYYVDLTPEIYVLNKDRVIIGKNLKTDQIQSIIDRDIEKRKKEGVN
jgi:peroxiredoxin